jgi:hypothetical protein
MPIFALVDEKARLLSLKEINKQAVAVLADFPFFRLLARDITILYPTPRDGGGTLVKDRLERQLFCKQLGKEWECAVHTHTMGL